MKKLPNTYRQHSFTPCATESKLCSPPAKLTVVRQKSHFKYPPPPPTERASQCCEKHQDCKPTKNSPMDHLIKLSSVIVISLLGA